MLAAEAGLLLVDIQVRPVPFSPNEFDVCIICFKPKLKERSIVSIFLDQFHKAMPNVTFSYKDTACNMFDLTFSHKLSEEKRYHFVLKEHKIFNRN